MSQVQGAATPQRRLQRILDVNGNRAAEGLRALEEVARFLLDDLGIALRLKSLRQSLRQSMPVACAAARDADHDVGTAYQAGTALRPTLLAYLRANAARVQEALRAAEEASRLAGLGALAAVCEHTRYQAYSIESALLSRCCAWRLWQVRLYILVDTALCEDPVAVAAAAVRGGAGAIQLRAKNLASRAYRDLALRVQEATRQAGGFFIVNDHVDVAAALAADGVHVGQEDLPLADVRAVVGPLCAIGSSCHTPEQVAAAQAEGADYVGLGPMFATTTKPHEPCRGPELLDAVKAILRLPSYAIGGLDAERIRDLSGRIPHGVAVAGAICRAQNPEAATRALADILEREDPLLAGAS